jgi:hypothetical protein
MDQFPKPPIDDEAKARDGPYCDSYSTEEKEQVRRRNKICLDSFGEGLESLLSSLEASGETEGVFQLNVPSLTRKSKPAFTILLVNTNHKLGHDHTQDFIAKGFVKISETHAFEESTLQVWIRTDGLIIYRSPLYRLSYSDCDFLGGFLTKESVRRDKSRSCVKVFVSSSLH